MSDAKVTNSVTTEKPEINQGRTYGNTFLENRAMPRRSCAAITRAGTPCRVGAIEGTQFCFWHTSAEKVREAGRKGYLVSRGKLQRGLGMTLKKIRPVRNLDQLTEQIRVIVNDLKLGRIAPSTGRECIQGLATIARLKLDAEVAGQLARLNEALEQRGQGGEALLDALDALSDRGQD